MKCYVLEKSIQLFMNHTDIKNSFLSIWCETWRLPDMCTLQGAQRKWLQLDFSLLRSNVRLQRPNFDFGMKSKPFLIILAYKRYSEVIMWPQKRPILYIVCEKFIKWPNSSLWSNWGNWSRYGRSWHWYALICAHIGLCDLNDL